MVIFAGYSMPLQYPSGILQEHRHTREQAGLFDVSHMGQVRLADGAEDAAAALETLLPMDIRGLAAGRQRYAFFTDPAGGILDDLMVARLDSDPQTLHLVVNAARKQHDIEHLTQLAPRCRVTPLVDRALLALQGPRAATVLARLNPAAAELRFMQLATLQLVGADCLVSRSGYTGEDGFEISVPADRAVALFEALLEHDQVRPVGLGARDSLRLEAGLCLYGQDIDTDTSPAEAGLNWAIQKVRRRGGEHEGGFPGAERVLPELQRPPRRRRVGLRPLGKAPVRAGSALFARDQADQAVGRVTSGGFGPSVDAPIAMGYIDAALARPGVELLAKVRGRELPLQVAELPFVAHRYLR